MSGPRQDDLAKRLAARIDKAPTKGRAMRPPAEQATSPRSPTAARKPPPMPNASNVAPAPVDPAPRPLTRGHTGTVRRGHLVPDRLHGEARRRKARLRAARGGKVTWDDAMLEAIDLATRRPELLGPILEQIDHSAARHEPRRLVQATLPAEVDQRLVEAHLDLNDGSDDPITYERLWAAIIMLWLQATA